jgi:hypothetical protein
MYSILENNLLQVMASKPRSDVYIGLPALQKLDGMLMVSPASLN